jgi:hypothetical protein
MDFNGDEPEDVEANAILTKHLYDPEEGLNLQEQFIAADFFKYGWEAAKRFFNPESGDTK